MVGFENKKPNNDNSILSLTSKMVETSEGAEAYDVKLELPNHVSFNNPEIKNHLRQSVPPDWPDITMRVQKINRDSTENRNTYHLRLFRKNVAPQSQGLSPSPTFAAMNTKMLKESLVLPTLVRVADSLDIFGDTKSASIVDSIIKEATEKSANYYGYDARDFAAGRSKWYDKLSPDGRTAYLEDPTGETDKVIEVSVRYEVCPTCEGEGKYVNPSIDAGGITREDWDDDPDFREEYDSGMYDMVCQECNGRNVVPVPREGHPNYEVVAKYIADKAEWDRESYHERRMGY